MTLNVSTLSIPLIMILPVLTYKMHLNISSWMTVNFLTLNSSETEFLLIGNRQQLTEIRNTSLNTTHFAVCPQSWLCF